MRQSILRAGLLGDPTSTTTDAAQSCALQAYDNDSVSSASQACGQALLESDPSLTQSISTIFENILQDGLNEAKVTTVTALGAFGAIEAFIAIFGSDAITNLLFTIVADLAGYISAAVTAVAIEVGVTSIATSVTAGASSFGYVGAVIGFIIGATIGIAEYLNPHSIQTTYGLVIPSQTYVETNLVNATNWLKNQKTLAGITPTYFATVQGLFLANPTWLWANQAITGMCQPIPPEQGSGSAVDFVFTQCPGAFELLSRAQFAEACFLVGTTPSKLGFYMSIAKPTSVNPTANPINNPNNYNPIWSQADLYGSQAWTPDNPDSDVTFKTGGILNPDTQALNWSWGANDPTVNPSTVNATACTPQGTAIQADTEVQDTSSNPTYGGRGYASYYYSSCPNLVTNNNTLDSNGNPNGQTDIAEGIYNLQVIYPALTTNQCLCIFNANRQAYINWVAKARAWANQICAYPSDQRLGTGSQWNLELADVHDIQGQWAPPAGCPAHKTTTTTTSPVTTTVKTTALIGGAAVMGIAGYAYYSGLTVTGAAKSLFGAAMKIAKGLV